MPEATPLVSIWTTARAQCYRTPSWNFYNANETITQVITELQGLPRNLSSRLEFMVGSDLNSSNLKFGAGQGPSQCKKRAESGDLDSQPPTSFLARLPLTPSRWSAFSTPDQTISHAVHGVPTSPPVKTQILTMPTRPPLEWPQLPL